MEMDKQAERILQLIPSDGTTITAREIHDITGISMRDIYDVLTRLSVKYGQPIGSSRRGKKGYFIIKSETERKAVMAQLSSHIQTMTVHLRAIESAEI
ncbi:hypothetical protein [Paucilactobacillus nenjiangensis]|jgi:hypothetical protein|uniref:hypothetical protein n=1 Tax=Paucilactobacillus nenjiangensis TaxID=1296540 RepID=UPI003BB1AA79